MTTKKENKLICNTLLNERRMKTLSLFAHGVNGFHFIDKNGTNQVNLTVMLNAYCQCRNKDADLPFSPKDIRSHLLQDSKSILCDIDNLLSHKFLEQVDDNCIQITASGSAAYRIAQHYLKEKAEHKQARKDVIKLSLMGICLLIYSIILTVKFVF